MIRYVSILKFAKKIVSSEHMNPEVKFSTHALKLPQETIDAGIFCLMLIVFIIYAKQNISECLLICCVTG